jgi:hypothetical protein
MHFDGQQKSCVCGRQKPQITGCKDSTDEPCEGILHARVRGGRRGTTPAPTRQRPAIALRLQSTRPAGRVLNRGDNYGMLTLLAAL